MQKKIYTDNNKMIKFNINKLMCEEDNQKYIHEIEKDLEAKQVNVKKIRVQVESNKGSH